MTIDPDHKIAGVLAPVFALRSKDTLGVGDVGSLRLFVDWAASIGMKVVQILPINETGGDNSPYNAISSVALDVTTIEAHPGALTDLTAQAFKQVLADHDMAAIVEGPVDYAVVKALKHALLAKAYGRFVEREWKKSGKRAQEFTEFRERQSSWLESYSLFRVLMERNGSERWNSWPVEHATPEAAEAWLETLGERGRKEFASRRMYYEYVQWVAFSQWLALRVYCESKGVALMGDVPFGVSYYSADVYAERGIFRLDLSGGAPPEPYFKDDAFTQKWGQNWGVPLYNWDAMREDNFRWWRQRVRMVREILDLFRIDHVLGCFRIYAFPWRPEENATFLPLTPEEAITHTGGRLPGFQLRDDSTPENCAANRADGEALLRVLLEETGTFRLIGEDLGQVPDYVRPCLQSLGIAGFKIPIWEKDWSGELIRGEHYERLSLATYATHDHEPLKALWDRWLADIQNNTPDADTARAEMHRLMRFAGMDYHHGWPELDAERHLALLAALFRSNSWMAVSMITDLFGSATRFNVPGAISASNWSNRLEVPVDKWSADPQLGPLTQRLAALLRETGRA